MMMIDMFPKAALNSRSTVPVSIGTAVCFAVHKHIPTLNNIIVI